MCTKVRYDRHGHQQVVEELTKTFVVHVVKESVTGTVTKMRLRESKSFGTLYRS